MPNAIIFFQNKIKNVTLVCMSFGRVKQIWLAPEPNLLGNKCIYRLVGSMSREWLSHVEIGKKNENFFYVSFSSTKLQFFAVITSTN